MLYTKLTQRAMQICFEAHRDQVDKGGMPYVFHPFHLAEQMETEEETCTALLHDVMEDTAWTYEQLAAEGFPSSVMEALALLTHDDNTPYLDYVERLSGNRIAARVKLADLRHNSTAGRLPVIGEKERKRMRKYLRAQAILTRGAADLEEMTLCLQTLLSTAGSTCRLTVILEPDGRVRRYGLSFPADRQEQKYRELYPLLEDLEGQGGSAAQAAAWFSRFS
ncbi:MAG: hypothetical protein UHU21_17125 [Lachnospiraceae bacterium]|nr:hypothetical protein [Lachnospiraceae bacterium]